MITHRGAHDCARFLFDIEEKVSLQLAHDESALFRAFSMQRRRAEIRAPRASPRVVAQYMTVCACSSGWRGAASMEPGLAASLGLVVTSHAHRVPRLGVAVVEGVLRRTWGHGLARRGQRLCPQIAIAERCTTAVTLVWGLAHLHGMIRLVRVQWSMGQLQWQQSFGVALTRSGQGVQLAT